MALARKRQSAPTGDLTEIMGNARDAADFLKALAHESRLEILCLLSQGEKSVGELETALELRQSTVSQQLARLRLEGLVTTRREGKSIHYSLANGDVQTILNAIYKVFCT